MLDQPVRNLMEESKLLTAPPESTVSSAAKLMAARNVGAVLVLKEECLIGIFTERDAVFRVIARGLDASSTRLADVMTAAPKTLNPEMSYGHALLLMQESGFRHVPILENGRVIGIVSSRNAMDPDLEEFVSEQRRREHYR